MLRDGFFHHFAARARYQSRMARERRLRPAAGATGWLRQPGAAAKGPLPSSGRRSGQSLRRAAVPGGGTSAAAAGESGIGRVAANFTRDQVKALEAALMQSMRMQSHNQFRLLLLSLAGLGVLAILFQEDLINLLGRHGGDVAAKSLEHEAVQLKANEVAKAVVNTVLNDEEVLRRSAVFVTQLLRKEETQAELVRVVKATLQDEAVRQEAGRLGVWIVDHLSRDAGTVQRAGALIAAAMRTEAVRDSAVELSNLVLAMESVRRSASSTALAVMQMEEFQRQVNTTLTAGFAEALRSTAVQDQARGLVNTMCKDPEVQAAVGQGLYRATMYSVTPGWILPIIGVDKKSEQKDAAAEPKPGSAAQRDDSEGGRAASAGESDTSAPAQASD